MRLVSHSPSQCTISYDDPYTGDRITARYAVRSDGQCGYVRETSADGRQVCEGLYRTGSTLMHTASPAHPLAGRIRSEYYRMIRAARREMASR
jgi:hypothetical protein